MARYDCKEVKIYILDWSDTIEIIPNTSRKNMIQNTDIRQKMIMLLNFKSETNPLYSRNSTSVLVIYPLYTLLYISPRSRRVLSRVRQPGHPGIRGPPARHLACAQSGGTALRRLLLPTHCHPPHRWYDLQWGDRSWWVDHLLRFVASFSPHTATLHTVDMTFNGETVPGG